MKKLLLFSLLVFGIMLGSSKLYAAASISYSPATNVYTVGVGPITTLSPATGGFLFAPNQFAINKALPAGLSFSLTTGKITGTPTAPSVYTSYIITVTGTSSSFPFGTTTATTTIYITVNGATPPIISYPTPDTYTTGNSVTLNPTSTGGAVTTYAAPSLPAGLTINAATGVISGTVSTAGIGNYIVTATNSGGSYPFTINITVNNLPPPTLTYASGNVYTVGTLYTLTPTNSGGTPTSCSVSPSLPAGLSISNTTGVISGTPTTPSTITNYTVTATNAGGSALSNTFTITVVPKTPVISYTSPNTFYVGTTITPLSPTNTGGPVASYSVSSLPAGLAIDPVTGIISGTPMMVTATNIYTVSATNAGGTGTFPITITVLAPYISENTTTGGLAANPITGNQSNIAIFGMSVQAVGGPATISALSFTSTQTISTYFPTVSLYSYTTATFPGTAAATLVATQASPAGTNITFSGLSPSLAAGSTLYYYLVVSYTEISAAPAPFQFNLNTITSASGVTYVSKTGTNYTFTTGGGFDWRGTISTDWNTASNWQQGVVPGQYDAANIGVNYAYTRYPTVSTGTVKIKSVIFGGDYNPAYGGISVSTGATLSVSGDITLQADVYASAYGVSQADLFGGGTVTAANVNVLSNYDSNIFNYNLGFVNNGVTLVLTGNIALTSQSDNLGFLGIYPRNSVFEQEVGTTLVNGVLKSTNQAGATSTFTILPYLSVPTTLQLANAAALSGLSATGTNVVTFNNTAAIVEYSGASQTVYTNLGITGLATGPSYFSIKFSGTGIKTPNGTAANALNIAGDFTNALANDPANYVSLTNTIVNFNGNNAQSLAGGAGPTYSATSTIAAPNPAGTVFNVVNFSGGSAGVAKTMVSGGFAVASTGVLTMVGASSYTVLNANGNLTLNSSATSTATVAKITAGGPYITGNVNVQRYVTGGTGYRGYRLMSSPVNGTSDGYPGNYSVNYLINSTYLRGSTGIGFDGVGNDNIYLYRENLAPSNATFTSGNYNGIASLGTAPNYSYPIDGNTGSPTFNIPVGDGFLFFFRGDRRVDTYANETVSTYVPTSAITITTGKLNQGAYAVRDWYNTASPYLGRTSATANAAVRGFNLVGNPYASTIDLTTASTTAGAGLQLSKITNIPLGIYGIETNFYELNPLTQNFEVWSNSLGTGTNKATKYISSGQGFFVVADTTNQTLTFNETAKVNNQNAGLNLFMATRGDVAMLTKGTGEDQHLRLQMAMDSVNTDDIYIAFQPGAQSKYVINEDAAYRMGQGKVSISSLSSDNVPLAISAMALPKVTETIKLNVSALTDGIYTLKMTELKNIPVRYEVWLMDAYKKDSLDIRHNTTYTFNLAHADTSSFGANRFSLVLREDPALKLHLLDFAAAKAVAGATVTWKTENEDVTTVFTVQRSTDKGATFEDLGSLQSNAGGAYSFADKNPVVPRDAYRLKLTDLDGNVSFSKVITLIYSGLNDGLAKNNIVIYPNPANGVINLAVVQNSGIAGGVLNYLNTSLIDSRTAKAQTQQGGATYSIKIINNTGSIVKSATSAEPVWQTNVSSLLPGTYIIQVMNTKDNSSIGRGTFVKL